MKTECTSQLTMEQVKNENLPLVRNEVQNLSGIAYMLVLVLLLRVHNIFYHDKKIRRDQSIKKEHGSSDIVCFTK